MSIRSFIALAALGGTVFALAACTGRPAPAAAPTPVASSLAASPPASPPTSPRATSAPSSVAPAVPAYFLGDWLGHRRDMTIRPDGTASFSVATMVTCGHEKPGQPCDAPDGGGGIERLDLRIDVRDGAVFATVVRTNDAPDDPVGTSYQLVPAVDQTFVMRRTGRASFPMCSKTRTKDLMAC